jgi:hypothetical protein
MPDAGSIWKTVRRVVFTGLMTLAWGLWPMSILGELAARSFKSEGLKLPLGVLVLASMGSLLLWCFVIYWWDPKLSRVGWLSLVLLSLLWFITLLVAV